MSKTVTLEKTNIQATLKKVRRSKSIRISVHQDGRVVVTAPYYVSYPAMHAYLIDHHAWVQKYIEKLPAPQRIDSTDAYVQHKERARTFIHARLAYWNQFYGFQYERVSIRNSRTRWGSCSSKGNLNFSYKLVLLPQELADYVIVHELCHLAELNHSSAFWQLVAQQMPQYKVLKKMLTMQVL